MRYLFLIMISAVLAWQAGAETLQTNCIKMNPAEGMERAELYYIKTQEKPKAFLVLSPGRNGNGKSLITKKEWREFAREHNLILVGLSFASPLECLLDGTGYYYPEKGSGKLFMDALDKIHHERLPILMYGFSGGAHFTSRIMVRYPGRVLSWCAFSAGWWPDVAENLPAGIVACGSEDDRHESSFYFFQEGRKLKNDWLWLSIPDQRHVPCAKLDKFVMFYFSKVLSCSEKMIRLPQSFWIDIRDGKIVEEKFAVSLPEITLKLWDRELLEKWITTCGKGLK